MLTLLFEVAMEHSFLQDYEKLHRHYHMYIDKKPPKGVGVLRKRCSENMQNHTLAWIFSFKFAAYFQNSFS